MASFSSDEDKAALVAAIQAVEARTSAELVICVRRQSGSYLHADLLAGIAAAIAALACLLYLPVDFGLHAFLIDPILAGVVVALSCSRLPMLRRWLTRAAVREHAVQEAAHASFFAKGIRRTSDAIGILIYISALERRAVVVIDDGVARAVPEQDWRAAVLVLEASVHAGADARVVCKAIEALGEVLQPCLPRSEDDVNELSDEVHE
jgi:putative membrane protein